MPDVPGRGLDADARSEHQPAGAGRARPAEAGADAEQVAARLHDLGQRGHGRQDHHRTGEVRPARPARISADFASARLPGVRQGRRVPIAESDDGVGPWSLALRLRRQGPLRQTDPPRRPDLPGSRALHPVRALRPLPGRARRRPGARLQQPRPRLGDHLQERSALRLEVLRQYHRYLPGRRADDRRFPLQGARLGAALGPQHLPALPGRLRPGARYALQQPDARDAARERLCQ